MTRRLTGRTCAIAGLIVLGALWAAAAPAQAARYWTIRPVAPSPLLWLGATPGSQIGAASLSPPAAGNLGQHWTMTGGNLTTKSLSLRNRQTGGCLTLQPRPPYNDNNHRVVISNCGYFNEVWRLYTPSGVGPLSATTSPTGYQIRNAVSGKCLGVPYFEYRAGTQLQQYTCSSSYKQRWRLSYFNDP